MIILTFVFLLILCAFPKPVSQSVADSLSVCIKSVIPSLFPFVVCSNIIIKNPGSMNNPVFLVISRFFNISPVSVWAFIPGILCGFPVGGKIALDLYSENLISEKEKDRLLVFCNNSGPGFIIGMVGSTLFNSLKTGIILYLCHILASVTYGFITRLYSGPLCISKEKNKENPKLSLSRLVTDSIKQGMESMINITGVICFFSSLIAVFDLIPIMSSYKFKGLIYGMLEITNGIKIITHSPVLHEIKICMSAFLLSFSGISVFMQLKTFSDKINTADYLKGKLLCGILSFLYCVIFLKYCN